MKLLTISILCSKGFSVFNSFTAFHFFVALSKVNLFLFISTTSDEFFAYLGNQAILVDTNASSSRATNKRLASKTTKKARSYFFSVSGGGLTINRDVGDVLLYLIYPLSPGVSYTIQIDVYEDGVYLSTVTLQATTGEWKFICDEIACHPST